MYVFTLMHLFISRLQYLKSQLSCKHAHPVELISWYLKTPPAVISGVSTHVTPGIIWFSALLIDTLPADSDRGQGSTLGHVTLCVLVVNEWLGCLKNHCQRCLQEIILVRIYKMWFNEVRWQGWLYYLLNEWNTKFK